MNKFKRLSDFEKIDVKSYVTDYIITHPDIKVFIGCDSQTFDKITKYATVIVLHGNRGGHVLYNVDIVPVIRETKMRILGEVNRSVEIASYLKYECGIDIEFIDLDINDDPYYKSNEALREAVGYVEGMGFKSRHKPEELWAISAANVLCR